MQLRCFDVLHGDITREGINRQARRVKCSEGNDAAGGFQNCCVFDSALLDLHMAAEGLHIQRPCGHGADRHIAAAAVYKRIACRYLLQILFAREAFHGQLLQGGQVACRNMAAAGIDREAWRHDLIRCQGQNADRGRA